MSHTDSDTTKHTAPEQEPAAANPDTLTPNTAPEQTPGDDRAQFTQEQPIPGAKIEVAYAQTMWEITGKFRGGQELGDALYDCLEILVKAVGCEAGILWFKGEGDDGHLHALHSIGSVEANSVCITPGEGFVGTAFETETFALVNDCKSDPRWSASLDGELSFDTRSTICTVLSVGLDTIGCVQLLNKDEGFTDEDYDVTELFGLIAGMVMQERGFSLGDMSPREEIITLRDIKKEFGSGDTLTRILHGVNLNFYQGEFAVILGESGCGKSTLLNIVGGMDSPTSGAFVFEGQNFAEASERELTEFRRNNIGFVFQSYNLMPNLTALENLDFIAELREEPADSETMLSLVKLQDRQNNYPSEMSGGQQQRVSIARALVKNPTLILADEPTAALDYATSIEVLTLFENICAKGVTLIVVTHNEEITRMADRVIRLKNGVVYSIQTNRNPAKAADLVW